MYCTKCGAKLEPNERFCPFCGQAVEEAPARPAAPTPAQPPEPQPIPSQPPIPHRKPPKWALIAAAAAVGAVILAAILAAVFLHGREDDPKGPEGSPDPSPSAGASEIPSGSETPEESRPAALRLSDLYIGTWAAEGCAVGDEETGWQALYLDSVSENTLTFTLEKVQSAPSSRIATTYPITVTVEDGAGTFPVNDSWGNSGTGELTLKGNAIHITVDITALDPNSLWDISMDADFYPDQITVATGEGTLTLPQAPYVDNGQVMIPMEPVFEAVGIAVFQDDYTLVGLTEREAMTLTEWEEGYFELSTGSGGLDLERSNLVCFSDGCHYVPLDTLDVFGLQTDWDAAGKVITIRGAIAAVDRVSAEKVEALKGFDKDAAGARVQNAGFSFAAAGLYNGYWGGAKYWSIPVVTADGTQYATVSYDGANYQMTVEPAKYY